jgi:hypothetical protein
VQVFHAGPNSTGTSWRIELHDRGRVKVYRRTGKSIGGTALRHPSDVDELARWLHERGLDVNDLEQT